MTRRGLSINGPKPFSGLLVIAGLTICCATRSIAADCAQWAIAGPWEATQASGIPVQFEIHQNGSSLSGRASFSVVTEKPPSFCKEVPDIPVGIAGGCWVAKRLGAKSEAVTIGEMKGSIKGNQVALNVNWHRTPTDESRYRGIIDRTGRISGDAYWTNGQTSTTDKWNFTRSVECIAATPPATAAAPPVTPVKPLGKVPGSTPSSPGPAYEEASQNFDIVGLHNRPGSDYANFETTGAFGDQVGFCAKTCLNDQRCKAWAYVRPGFFGQPGSTGRCWLKDNIPAVIKDQCCFTGVRKTTAVATPPSAPSGGTTANVIADVDVYAAPGGKGNPVGMLSTGATVTLLSACADNWCNVSGPAVPGGSGWVYDGPDYPSLRY